MNLRGIREDLLKVSLDDFASEYELTISEVELLEKTNEVPLSLVKLISKKSGYSVGDLLKYDGLSSLKDNSANTPTSDRHEHLVSRFSYIEKESIVTQFENWLQENNQQLVLSKRVKQWVQDNIIWILNEYENEQQGSIQETEAVTEKEVVEFSERLTTTSQNEIVKLQFILDDKKRSESIIKNAVNLEVTRLIKEDSILDETVKKLTEINDKNLKDVHAVLLKMTSAKYIEEVMRREHSDDNVYVDLYIDIKKACNQKQEEFIGAIKQVVQDEKGLIQFYNTELNELFANGPELNSFSAEIVYYKHFKYGLCHPDIFNLKFPEVSDEETEKRDKATSKRRVKEAARDFALNFLFPPKGVIDVFTAGSKHNLAKETAKYINEHHTLEDFYNQITYYNQLIVAAATFALKGIKTDWKTYFDETIDLVQKDERDIKDLISDETRKILIAKSIQEAFKED